MKFSVIIPTFNRPADLARCLAAVARMDYHKHEFEVIVVDDGGSDDLEPLVDAHRSKLQVRLYRQPNQGPAAARNLGALHATGRFLAFIDDDCEPRSEWLLALDAALQRTPDALIGGRVVNGYPRNQYSAASQEIADFCDRHFNGDPDHGRFFPSNNIAVAAELYREIGGFDLAFQRSAAEDRDFCDRWLGRGWRLVSARDAVVLHHRAMSLASFWKQHFLYGRGGFSFALARRRRNAGPVPFEGWRFHERMILVPLRRSMAPFSLYLSLLILVSQFAVASGYLSEARKQKQLRLASGYNLARK